MEHPIALKFPLLDDIFEEIQALGNMSIFNASPFEHFDVVIKQSYRTKVNILARGMDETDNNVAPTLLNLSYSHNTGGVVVD